ncbi:MAG TPA: hypothetical protein VH478_21290 [Trebonia sp.]|jgi:hypothetical protein|nr:hypothetical protein [Trebonia sp.]
MIALISGLPTYTGPICDPVPTDEVRLALRDKSGQVIGSAVVPQTSCTAQLSMPGQTRPRLADNPAVMGDLLHIAGIHWFGY